MKISIDVFQQRYFSFLKERSMYTLFLTFYSILRKSRINVGRNEKDLAKSCKKVQK